MISSRKPTDKPEKEYEEKLFRASRDPSQNIQNGYVNIYVQVMTWSLDSVSSKGRTAFHREEGSTSERRRIPTPDGSRLRNVNRPGGYCFEGPQEVLHTRKVSLRRIDFLLLLRTRRISMAVSTSPTHQGAVRANLARIEILCPHTGTVIAASTASAVVL